MRPFRNKREVFEGNKVGLRNLLYADANKKYLSWLQDKRVNRFMSSNLPAKIIQLRRYCESMNKSREDIIFAIRIKKNNKHIGNATLQAINKRKDSAIFGIMVGDKKEWGKGYGEEATRLVLSYGFLRLGLKNIILGVHPRHETAINLYTKVGFRRIKKEKNKLWFCIERSKFEEGM